MVNSSNMSLDWCLGVWLPKSGAWEIVFAAQGVEKVGRTPIAECMFLGRMTAFELFVSVLS